VNPLSRFCARARRWPAKAGGVRDFTTETQRAQIPSPTCHLERVSSAQDDTIGDAIHQAGWKPAPQHGTTELWGRHPCLPSDDLPKNERVQARHHAGGAAVLRAQRIGAVGDRNEHSCSDRTHAVTVAAVEDRSRLRRPNHPRCVAMPLRPLRPLRFKMRRCDVLAHLASSRFNCDES